MKKYFISLTLILSITGCGQTEIETPLYAQPKRRVNAQVQGGYVGPANAALVNNNPAMAQFTIPGQSLSAVGQQGYNNPMNLNGQMSPWNYMPAPSGGMGMMQPQMQMMPPQAPMMMQPQMQMMPQQQYGGGMGGGMGMMPQQQMGYPSVEYGNPPFSGGSNPYGSPSLPPMPDMGGMGGGGMPYPDPMQQQMQPPYPPQGGGMMMQNQIPYPPYQGGGLSYEQNIPLPNLEQQAASNIPLPELKTDKYATLSEDDYELEDGETQDLFGFFNENGNAGAPVEIGQAQAPDISEVENVDLMAVQVPQSEQQFMQTPQLIRVDTAQANYGYQQQHNDAYQQPYTQPQQYQQQAFYQQPYAPYAPQVDENLTTQSPKSLMFKSQQQVNYPNDYHKNYDISANKSVSTVRQVQVPYRNARNVKSQPVRATVTPVARNSIPQGNVVDLGWRDAPKTLNYSSPRSIRANNNTSASNYPPTYRYRYKEDYAPVRSGTTSNTWYPKSMTRI